MSTFTQIYYHIVFSTKNRERVLLANRRDDLFRYIWGILKNKDCHLYRISGVEDHLHILTEIHPTIALATLVKDIKISTSFGLNKTTFSLLRSLAGMLRCIHGYARRQRRGD
jgi:REP element-mobilizing transposase RayT